MTASATTGVRQLTDGGVRRFAVLARAVVSRHGRPDAVVAVASGGVRIGAELARDLGVPLFVVTCRRATSAGRAGRVKQWVAGRLPWSIEQGYRRHVFPRLAARQPATIRPVDLGSHEAGLVSAVRRGDVRSVWVVDDAGDSGATMVSVRTAIEAECPDVAATFLLLGATTERGAAAADYCAVGSVVLDKGSRAEPVDDLLRAERGGTSAGRAGARSFVDLDGTLIRRNSYFVAVRHVLTAWARRGRLDAVLALVVCSSIGRLCRRRAVVKAALDRSFAALPPPVAARVLDRIVADCTASRRRLLTEWAARRDAPVVTAACCFYAPALCAGLGVPLALSSGRDETGRWREIDLAAKAAFLGEHGPARYVTDDPAELAVAAEAWLVPEWDHDGMIVVDALQSSDVEPAWVHAEGGRSAP